MKPRTWLAASALLASLCFPAVAHADVDLAVTPSKVEVTATPGAASRKSLTIFNKGKKSLQLKLYVMDYRINPDNSFEFSAPGHESYSAATWISLEASTVVVPPGKARKVGFELSVPRAAEAGGHYAVIFTESPEVGKKAGNLIGRVGSLVLVTVDGKVDRQGDIASFDVSNPRYTRDVLTNAVFENTGNVHITTRGRVDFLDGKGRNVGQADLGEITILPGTERIMTVEWPDAPAFGKFTAVANISYGPDLSTFNVTKTARKDFVIIPWAHIGAASAVAAALAIVLILFRGWFNRNFTRVARQ